MDDLAFALTVEEQAEQDWRNWLAQYEWHLDQVPVLIETMRSAVSPLRAQTLEAKVSGGGYRDYAPLDLDAVDDSDTLWGLLVEYFDAVILAIGFAPQRMIVRILPNDPLVGRSEALRVVGWLIERVEMIVDHEHLSEIEGRLFARIRRARGVYRTAGTPRRAQPRRCNTCGERAVLVDWVTTESGRSSQVGLCKSCGETYLPAGENRSQ